MIYQYEPDVSNYINDVLEQLKSGWIGPGKTVEDVENIFSNILNSRHCVLTVSGTVALWLAIQCCTPRNSRGYIAVPAYGYVAAANAARLCGHDVVPIDVSNENFCMNPDKLELILQEKKDIFAVIFINHNGYNGQDLQKVKEICQKYQCILIEDSAVSVGISRSGITGNLSIFSFSVPKLITAGQGGLITTDSSYYYKIIKELTDQGDNWRSDRNHKNIGLNLRMTDLQASLLKPQVMDLNKLIKKRRKVWNTYLSSLNIIDIYDESGWCVIYRTSNAIGLQKYLKSKGIQSSLFYKSLYNNTAYTYLRKDYNCPVSEYLENELLYLPSSLTLSIDTIGTICLTINKWEKKLR